MPAVQNSSSISRLILNWYDAHARDLPWRISSAERKNGVRPDPYRVWLSEIMLQQTTVATVAPRYDRFLSLWPDLEALALAKQEEVLAEWAGLGYYARARNLHKCAQVLMVDYAGVFPKIAADLQKLPGIGPYTAAAIASIAFDQPAPVMDGNIERVMARLFAVAEPLPGAKPALYEHAAGLTPQKRPGDYAQGLMDLGATICTPRNQVCSRCPLKKKCKAFSQGTAHILPRKEKKTAKPTRHGVAFVIGRATDGAVLLVRRPEKGLLGGMLAFPSTEWREDKSIRISAPIHVKWDKSANPVLHTFTHFHLVMEVWQTSLPSYKVKTLPGEWHRSPASAGLPTVFQKVLERITL